MLGADKVTTGLSASAWRTCTVPSAKEQARKPAPDVEREPQSCGDQVRLRASALNVTLPPSLSSCTVLSFPWRVSTWTPRTIATKPSPAPRRRLEVRSEERLLPAGWSLPMHSNKLHRLKELALKMAKARMSGAKAKSTRPGTATHRSCSACGQDQRITTSPAESSIEDLASQARHFTPQLCPCRSMGVEYCPPTVSKTSTSAARAPASPAAMNRPQGEGLQQASGLLRGLQWTA
mmetsp:Transcript_13642/g.24066  ORF Transcript_13642/g.24066 Transcript_13642/m.24066 type:complete len:235 (-) Transcript_13642:333-1037(-)